MRSRDVDSRRLVACADACEGISTDDLKLICKLSPYLRLIKLSYLADRQAATMEGAPADPYLAPAVSQ